MRQWISKKSYIHGVWLVTLLACLISVQASRAATERTGSILYLQLCAVCHGFSAEGREEFKAPPLAQMPAWYVKKQMSHFKAGRRGSHHQDMEGAIMAAHMAVVDESHFEPIAKWVASQKRQVPEPLKAVKTDIGKVLYEERCMECHRYNATGDFFFQSPPLAGLPSWYLFRQIEKFKQGIRGFSKEDVHGQKMVFNVGYIHSEEEKQSLIAYIIELQRKNASIEELNFGQE